LGRAAQVDGAALETGTGVAPSSDYASVPRDVSSTTDGAIALPAGRFFGRAKFSRLLGQIRLTETTCSSGLRLPRHSHELGLVVFVLSGRYDEAYSNHETHERRPMSVLYHPAGMPHSEVHKTTGRRLIVELSSDLSTRLVEIGVELDRPCELDGTGSVARARQLYCEYCNPDAVSKLAVEMLTLDLFVRCRRARMRMRGCAPWFVRQAQEILRAKAVEGVSVQVLAREVGVEPVHLTKAFHHWTGQTISECMRRHRLDFACREMLRSDATLFDVAIAAGYYDQSHFCRTFRRDVGMTPSEFRRSVLRRSRPGGGSRESLNHDGLPACGPTHGNGIKG
jgi:AraC family transcriptional regulator